MDDKSKFRRDIIVRVLTWGMFVQFLVWGYAVTQSNLFELTTPAKTQQERLIEAKYNQAARLSEEAGVADTADTAKKKAEAAQIMMDIQLAKEMQDDRKRRAVGLIIGASIYCLIYPTTVWLAYQKTDRGDDVGKDLVPLKIALIYAIFMSLSVFYTAFTTAYW